MSELKEKYIQFCCDFYNEHAPEDKLWFGRMFEQCQEDYEQQNRCMYRWQFPLMILKDRQAEIDQLKAELSLCREENKGLIKSLNKKQIKIDELENQVQSARVLCETACELLADYSHQDAMMILDDLEKNLRGERESK